MRRFKGTELPVCDLKGFLLISLSLSLFYLVEIGSSIFYFSLVQYIGEMLLPVHVKIIGYGLSEWHIDCTLFGGFLAVPLPSLALLFKNILVLVKKITEKIIYNPEFLIVTPP